MSEQSHDSSSTNDTIHVDLNTAITIVVQNPPPVAEHQHQEQEQVFPRVRDHSYLPGTCHPLHTSFATSLSSSTATTTTTTTNSGIRNKRAKHHELKELPIIEIPGVVLFPGSTLPIRLTSPAWMDYLGRKIQTSRAMPGKQQQHDDMNNNDDVELGVLTFLTAQQQQPDFDNGRPQRILQRRSWTRQGFGPVRLRRFSLQLQRELIREGWHNEDSSDDDSNHDESELQITDSEQEEEEEEPLPVVQRRRFVGRIGTVATVTFTHGDNGSATSPAAATTRQSRQLVLTALGTQRFWVPPNEHNERQEQTPGHADFGVKVLMVQLLDDDVPSLRDKYTYSVTNPLLHRNIPNALPIVTPFPEYLFKSYWPWSLQVEIRRLLEEISTFQDLAQHLSNLEQDENEFIFSESHPWSNPVDFTFWLSSNLPLKQEEKIHLIEMRSVVERLRFLKKKVSRERKMESRIHCRECGATLANLEDVFTVGGAEGTTGAYVNVHGSIIQTTTVRAIDEDCVTYYGFPQTLDSWFPGYAWTIMSCGFCHSHLGWKFTTVGKRKLNEAARNRPDFFYGLAASSIDTYSNRLRRRINLSSRSNQR